MRYLQGFTLFCFDFYHSTLHPYSLLNLVTDALSPGFFFLFWFLSLDIQRSVLLNKNIYNASNKTDLAEQMVVQMAHMFTSPIFRDAGPAEPSCLSLGKTIGLTFLCEWPISAGWYPPSCHCTVGSHSWSCSHSVCSVDLTPLVPHVSDWSLLMKPNPWWMFSGMSSGILERDLVTVLKRFWPISLLEKRLDNARMFNKIKITNKLHPQLRPRSIYSFLFKNISV